jgi:hypothetical protein
MKMGMGFCFPFLTPNPLRLTTYGKVVTLCAMRPALCVSKEKTMPAIASLEDLKSAQRDLLEAKDLDELKRVFKKWRRIGWKNVCKLWLQERSPEELKGEAA